jgi:dynactin 1
METSRLIEQIDSLRRAVRFLRSENTVLKSQDLLEELSSLPTYDLPPSPPASPDRPTGLPSHPHRRLPADPLVSRQSFASQSRALLREARVLASTPRMVDISFIKPLVPSSPTSARRTSSRSPLVQYTLERERVASLGRRVDSLAESRPSRLVHA